MLKEAKLFRCIKSTKTARLLPEACDPLDSLMRWARYEPRAAAVVFDIAGTDRVLVRSYRDMLGRVLAACGSLLELPAGLIGIVTGQHGSTIEAVLAAIAAKRRFVLVDPLTRQFEREIARLGQCSPIALIIPSLEEMPELLIDRIGQLRRVCGEDCLWSMGANLMGTVDLLSDADLKRRVPRVTYSSEEWQQIIAYTYPRRPDGTDRAYLYSPRAICAAAGAVRNWLKLEEHTCLLCGVSISRCEGLIMALASLGSGGTCIIPSRTGPENFWRYATESRIDLARVEPTLIEDLLDRYPQLKPVGLTRLKKVVTDAGHLPGQVAGNFFDTFDVPIIQCFGTAYTGGYALGVPLDLSRREYELALRDGFAGAELDFCNVRIAPAPGTDPTSQRDPSEGLLEVRGLSVSAGCWDGKKLRHWQEPWLTTSTLAVARDKPGRLSYLVRGRINDALTIHGHRIWPAQVEHSLLETFSFLADCVVIDRPDPMGNNQLCAVVVLPANYDGHRRSELFGQIEARLSAKTVEGLDARALPEQLVPLAADQIPRDEEGRPDRPALKRILAEHDRTGGLTAS